ncbi:hypothetical protein F5Y17DRAFT_458581 [Xylariaceae sp. FL0594]|nr:hypothetical protein F5Y17DRAFT_458581 [Xylariaceae sp. FL0594]
MRRLIFTLTATPPCSHVKNLWINASSTYRQQDDSGFSYITKQDQDEGNNEVQGQDLANTTQQKEKRLLLHPDLSLPAPGLAYDFRMSVGLNPKIPVGAGVVPSGGHRNWISFSGGEWVAGWGRGRVVGGQDTQIVDPDTLVVRMETVYLLQTDDEPEPAFIEIRTRGFRTGPKDVLQALQDPGKEDTIDPSLYRFRLTVTMETGDERYRSIVNYGMWVGSGMRMGGDVVYE